MRYINIIILSLIAIVLFSISLKLTSLEMLLRAFNENASLLLHSNQGLTNTNQKLKIGIEGLQRKIEEIVYKLEKK